MLDIKITIGITAYRCNKYLKKAIDSVIAQNSNQWEGVLILDGGADKKTTQIFKLFEHPKFCKYAFKENQGPYGTRAKAIDLSNTEWYYQLDGDDILPLNAVKNVVDAIEKNPNAEYVYGDCLHFSEAISQLKRPANNPETLCFGPLFNAASPIKISLFERLNGFSNELYINADWDFWLSVYENNILGAYTDNLIYHRRQRGNNVGTTHLHLRPDIVEKIIQRHPEYFVSDLRKNKARFNVYQQMARQYRSNGDRGNAAKFARKALIYGNSIPVFETIFQEEKMSLIRYNLRRMGRHL